MMQVIVPRPWREEFAAVAARREDILHKEKLARFEDRERERRKDEKIEDEHRDAEALAAIEIALATPDDVAEFRAELDEYDSKTVEALMENSEALEAAQKHIDALLDDAYVLPDGRRVFKTKDGKRVFDEHGQELSLDEIDPAEIDDTKTKWEPYKAARDEHLRLSEERQELLDYQEKLDRARERLDEGDITKKELEKIESDLAADMPDAVREKLGLTPSKAEIVSTQEISATLKPAQPDELGDLLRQTGRAAVPSAPS